ncbi:MAG: PRC-barrel domain-containing protein [Bauldia sp.]
MLSLSPQLLRRVLAVAVPVALVHPAEAQGVKQVIGMPRLDPTTFAMGFRVTRLIGLMVVGESGETIGRIQDVIISREGTATRVVVAVGGGFMGIGARLVLIPYADLRLADSKATLPGATLGTLQALPEFKFAR